MGFVTDRIRRSVCRPLMFIFHAGDADDVARDDFRRGDALGDAAGSAGLVRRRRFPPDCRRATAIWTFMFDLGLAAVDLARVSTRPRYGIAAQKQRRHLHRRTARRLEPTAAATCFQDQVHQRWYRFCSARGPFGRLSFSCSTAPDGVQAPGNSSCCVAWLPAPRTGRTTFVSKRRRARAARRGGRSC